MGSPRPIKAEFYSFQHASTDLFEERLSPPLSFRSDRMRSVWRSGKQCRIALTRFRRFGRVLPRPAVVFQPVVRTVGFLRWRRNHSADRKLALWVFTQRFRG